MSTRTIRVTVRGSFDGLTDAQRAELAAKQSEHNFLTVDWSPRGHLSYEIDARPFFTFRYAGTAESESGIPAVTARAEATLIAWLDEHDYGYKGLKVTSQDMSEAPLGARQKRRKDRE